MQSKKFADSTMSKIKWATTLFKQWKSTRNIRANDPNVGLSPIRVDLAEMSLDELNYSISRFICEVRKTDGTEYPPDTLYSLVICLQLYMDTLGYNHKFLSDSSFIQIKNSLDNVMKLRADVHVPKKQAEEISLEEEEKLWASDSLGSGNARHLLNTLVYLIGINFALRGGQEHRDLKGGNSSQFQINEKNGLKCLIYTEAKSKADQGGIKHKNVKRKSVVAYQNTENQARCVVNLFELYASHCPPFPRKADALYLRPLKIPNGNIWYADQPIGRHSLANVVASICQEAGIGGYRTNHSLRARMYDAGVDEQLICKVTGHRSNAVRNYKRTNEKQKRKINSVIQGQTDSENDDSGKFKISKSDGNLSFTLNISMT
ncbi:transcriptional regulator QRICH1-like [Mytilus californianus]|uniref:transcriptional regulator QRICH1-like n=1 Tax=Mytilus californianus TaxID=6549 RepID=UPI0022453273|nr:transcriptional regulator QRICH1-like [Mytilus californianus]